MNLEQAVEIWAELSAARGGQGPSLPYTSMVAMTLAGQAVDPFSVGNLALLATSPYGSREVPLDMAPSRCKAIDSQFYDEYADRTGTRPKGAAVMEASWLATDRALYYIAPAIAGMRRWPWNEARVTPGRTGRQTAKFGVATGQGTWKFSTSARAMPNLLAIASWATDI